MFSFSLYIQLNANEDVMYWLQIGIVSWGLGCGGRHPGFYASVPSVMDWIWTTLNSSRNGKFREGFLIVFGCWIMF